jgi:hypothetical protein
MNELLKSMKGACNPRLFSRLADSLGVHIAGSYAMAGKGRSIELLLTTKQEGTLTKNRSS